MKWGEMDCADALGLERGLKIKTARGEIAKVLRAEG
jgi:hypothetical protein